MKRFSRCSKIELKNDILSLRAASSNKRGARYKDLWYIFGNAPVTTLATKQLNVELQQIQRGHVSSCLLVQSFSTNRAATKQM